MLVLDTDHLVEIDRGSAVGAALLERLQRSTEEAVTTIISAEEQLKGWLAQNNRTRDPHRQVSAYARLQRRITFFASWRLLPFDEGAADRFREPRRTGMRVATMGLKIACITMSNEATLLSRNIKDFRQVPGLKIDDWL